MYIVHYTVNNLHEPESIVRSRRGGHCLHDVLHIDVYSVQCTVYSVQCTLYSVQCIVYSVQCTVYSVQCTVYRVK